MGTLTTALVGQSADHRTALAGGFDIYEAGYWVRPDNAAIRRFEKVRGMGFQPLYKAYRDDGRSERFYTMTEAVEWIGGTR